MTRIADDPKLETMAKAAFLEFTRRAGTDFTDWDGAGPGTQDLWRAAIGAALRAGVQYDRPILRADG